MVHILGYLKSLVFIVHWRSPSLNELTPIIFNIEILKTYQYNLILNQQVGDGYQDELHVKVNLTFPFFKTCYFLTCNIILIRYWVLNL